MNPVVFAINAFRPNRGRGPLVHSYSWVAVPHCWSASYNPPGFYARSWVTSSNVSNRHRDAAA